MRTAHMLPVSPSMHCSRGMYRVLGVPGLGGAPGPRGYLVGGCTWSQGGYMVGGCTWSQGSTWFGRYTWSQGGVHLVLGGCTWSQGVYLVRGVYLVLGRDVPALGGGVPGQNSWHTLLKILPCPKLRLRAVKIRFLQEAIESFFALKHSEHKRSVQCAIHIEKWQW